MSSQPNTPTTPELTNFVNGARTDARGSESIALIDPATEDVYATAPVSTAEDVADAYRAAQDAFEVWGRTTPAERQLALFRIADAMEQRAEEFADLESQDTGKPRAGSSKSSSGRARRLPSPGP